MRLLAPRAGSAVHVGNRRSPLEGAGIRLVAPVRAPQGAGWTKWSRLRTVVQRSKIARVSGSASASFSNR
jgi:hypothetical protein